MQHLVNAFKESTESIAKMLRGISNELFLRKPAADKWSIAEILEHLNISDRGSFLAIAKSDQIATAEILEASERRIAEMLAYNSNNWVAPESANPKGTFIDAAAALELFLQTRQKILAFAESNELGLYNANIAHPRLGYLTRGQWLEFITWHATHHGAQMKKIIESQVA